MIAYTVTIGRNRGTSPMSEDEWREFRDLTELSLAGALEPQHLFIYDGTGEWEGVAEDSACFLVLSEHDHDLGPLLAMLAEAFGQDAIGWTSGPAHLATREVVAA